MTIILIRRLSISLLLCMGSAGLFAPSVAADKPKPALSIGQAAYQQHCARCHGATGKGDGRDAKRFYPRPRDLTEGVFKFRSTASGTPPTDEDLVATLTNGLPGSGMPDWRHLDEALRWQLVHYLKSLTPTFEQIPPQPVAVGEDPGSRHANLEQGKQVYEKLGCAACHGAAGRANGPSAATLMDNWGRQTRPADLTQGWTYRGGSDPRSIALRMLTGIDGTPMPSYAEAVSTEEAWQLAYYVRSLQQEPRWTMMAHVGYAAEGLPDSPDDSRWVSAQRGIVRLRNVVDADGSLNAPQTVTAVWFQALHDEETIQFRLVWHDPTEDRTEPSDAIAVVLRPVGVTGDVVTLQTWPLRDSPELDFCVWSANRPQAHEVLAKNYDPALQATGQTRLLASQASYDDGAWTVILSRPMEPSDLEGGARFLPRQFTPVAFVVWDGGNPGTRAVSTWVDLVVQPPAVSLPPQASPWIYVVWAISGIVLVVGLVFALKKR